MAKKVRLSRKRVDIAELGHIQSDQQHQAPLRS